MVRKEIQRIGRMPVYGCRLLNILLDEIKPESTILNVGIKHGIHTALIIRENHNVIGISPMKPEFTHERFTFICGLIETAELPPVDALWSSMTIEHSQNVGAFLTKCREALKPGGWFGIVAPTDRNDLLVDGHLNFWTPAHLIYNLVMAGWDCKDARWYTKGRDMGLIMQRVDRPPVELDYDRGDLGRLQPYFPIPLQHRITDPWLEDNI